MARNFDPVKALVFAAACLPAVLLSVWVATGGFGPNPIKEATLYTGLWAIRFLILALAVSPMARLTGVREIMRYRRMIGLFAFFYGLLHMLIYFVLDHFFHWETIVKDVVKRPFITIGMAVFVILAALAATSTNAMIRRMGGRRWRNLHRLVYVAGIGAGVHFLMAVKADVREPLIYLALIAVLLLLRLVSRRGLGGRAALRRT